MIIMKVLLSEPVHVNGCCECTGSIELVSGIAAGSSVSLVANVFPEHLAFLELVFQPGDTVATVTTRKELDADVLGDVSLMM